MPRAARYRARDPQKAVLHQIVHEHLETMLAEAALDGRGCPRFRDLPVRAHGPRTQRTWRGSVCL